MDMGDSWALDGRNTVAMTVANGSNNPKLSTHV